MNSEHFDVRFFNVRNNRSRSHNANSFAMKNYLCVTFLSVARFLLIVGMIFQFTRSNAQSYCPRELYGFNVYISNFQLGQIDNSVGNGDSNYSDYTSMIASLIKGDISTATITTPATSNGMYYVDWNQDGDFDDAEESASYVTGLNQTFQIAVPTSALPGPTRIRLVVTWPGFGNPSACGTEGGTVGEAEDYTVNVLEPLYSRTTGDWEGSNSWSNVALSGASCSCVPDETTPWIIIGDNHTISINEDHTIPNLVVENTGTLLYAAPFISLTLRDNTNLQVLDGGVLSDNNQSVSKIVIQNGNATIDIGTNSIFNIDHLDVTGHQLDIIGSGDVTINNQLFIENGIVTNQTTGTLTFKNLNTRYSSTFSNYGTVVHLEEFDFVGDANLIKNESGAHWKWNGATSPADLELILDVSSNPNVFEYIGSGFQAMIPITYDTLVISGGGTVRLNSSTPSVSSKLTLTSGNIELGDQDLTLNANASLIGGSPASFVVTNGQGTLRINDIGTSDGSVEFPVGPDADHFSPIFLTNTGIPDDYKVKVVQQARYGGLTGDSETMDVIDKTWIISEQSSGGSNVTLDFGWDLGDELTGFDQNAFMVSQFDESNSIWVDTGGTSSVQQVSTNRYKGGTDAVLTTLYPQALFAINNQNNPLPITLSYFKAERNGQTVILRWETLNELNNDYFTIEKSSNGEDWEILQTLDGAGNSAIPLKYSAEDKFPYSGHTYYRLMQTDFDGQFEYSPIAKIISDHLGRLTVFPNPAKNHITVQFHSIDWNDLHLTKLDGSSLMKKKQMNQTNDNSVYIDISKLENGLYLLKTGNEVVKILKH